MAHHRQLQKAKDELESKNIPCRIENGTLYVFVEDTPLELAEFEIQFRARLYDESSIDKNG